MERILKNLGVLFVMLLVIILFTLPAFAALEGDPDADAEILTPEPRPVTDDFGSSVIHYTWVHAHEFKQAFDPGYEYFGSGYYFRKSGAAAFRAPLKLPNGADIRDVRLFFYDNSASQNIILRLYRNNTDNNQSVLIREVDSSGQVGFGTRGFDPYPASIFDNYHQYMLTVILNDASNAHRFKGVRVAYKRTISPAPATATFPDVPIGSTHFRTIEALAASGITVGYTDGTYRPENFVTRAEMATFLSRALGLHYADPYKE